MSQLELYVLGILGFITRAFIDKIFSDQYKNENNPNAHYFGTGMELVEQTGGKIDVFVAGVGTGGTISGNGKVLKEKIPNIKIVGVDPHGSILAEPETLNKSDSSGFCEVEGLGSGDHVPEVLDRSCKPKFSKNNVVKI